MKRSNLCCTSPLVGLLFFHTSVSIAQVTHMLAPLNTGAAGHTYVPRIQFGDAAQTTAIRRPKIFFGYSVVSNASSVLEYFELHLKPSLFFEAEVFRVAKSRSLRQLCYTRRRSVASVSCEGRRQRRRIQRCGNHQSRRRSFGTFQTRGIRSRMPRKGREEPVAARPLELGTIFSQPLCVSSGLLRDPRFAHPFVYRVAKVCFHTSRCFLLVANG